jgi:hypothetical protein
MTTPAQAGEATGSVSGQDVEKMGPDTTALLINLMSQNDKEASKLHNDLIGSLQRDYDAALAEIAMIRRNVMTVLHRPHTDYMIEGALYSPVPLDSGGPA